MCWNIQRFPAKKEQQTFVDEPTEYSRVEQSFPHSGTAEHGFAAEEQEYYIRCHLDE